MHKKWSCLVLAVTFLLAILAGCKAPKLPEKAEDPTAGTQETLENIPGVGENEFNHEDFVDSDSVTTDPTKESTDPSQPETDPTQSTDPSQPSTDPSQTTDPTESTDSTEPTQPSEGSKITVYEWYESLSPEDQMAYYETFESMEAFVKWYNAAKAEYDKLHPPIESGDGNIDFGDIAGN